MLKMQARNKIVLKTFGSLEQKRYLCTNIHVIYKIDYEIQ